MLTLIILCGIMPKVLSDNPFPEYWYGNSNETDSQYLLDQLEDISLHQSIEKYHLLLNNNAEQQEYDREQFFKSMDCTSAEVCAKAGCIRGIVEKGRLRPYDAFYGIPYAEPPIGELRLENPTPHRGWNGYWDATYPRSDCTQRNVFLYTQPIVGSEDCLYLNVYRPKHQKYIEKLPVIVWIHGGALMSTSSSPDQFGPEYLMDNGEVILVTLNYRLGMFGFLCSGDEAVKGNFGLKDQQLALKWVATNIEYFGGDPNSVTLAGQSSGALSAQHHMMNPISSALFHRAILMSGTAIAPWAFSYDWALRFRLSAKNSGMQNWDSASTYELANHFKKLHALNLVLALDELFAFPLTPTTPLRPCIEGDWEGAFLKEDPRKMWSEGNFVPKPILIGTTTEDGTFAAIIPTNHTRLRIFNENIYDFLPIQLDFNPKYVSDVMKFYLGKDHIDETNVKSYYQMFGDRTLVNPMITLVNQYLKYADVQKSPVFIYEFGFESPFTFLKYSTGKNINLGASHIDDLSYLFTMSAFFPIFEVNSTEGLMVETYVKTVVNFAIRGEVKIWAELDQCTPFTNKPFCDRQIFKRFTKSNPDSIIASVSDQINERMVSFWNNIDKLI